ncbi:hypothetical protein [Anaeromyxobacter paludicola]|uniref:Outer membrane protein beta-barrel domain-containing protein n=1 Tax=Anaeromyxobacter paludicola TaxID=2918171 RepID=A0ABN6N8J7_9BACT|nr:hypothetical protein [Anaeromyxobacter paludicola]BDG09537.1 hypothetical protein AMPC_26500 [Anaeromyxobacter paludicola]
MILLPLLLATTLGQYDPDYPPPPPPPPPPSWRYRPAPPAQGGYEPARGGLGLVWMPLGVTGFSEATGNTGSFPEGQLNVELRPPTGGARLRAGFEYAEVARSVEVGLKYDFNDRGQVRPFVGVALGAGSIDPLSDWHATLGASVGVDLFVTRDFFFSMELKGKRFSGGDRRSDGWFYDPFGYTASQTSFQLGFGIYL